VRNFFFANRTLALKDTPNSTKHPKKNKNYNKVLGKPSIFNLQTMLTSRRCCCSSLSRPDVVGYGREVAERIKKTTSVLKTKKKEELPRKLLDDPKIPNISTISTLRFDVIPLIVCGRSNPGYCVSVVCISLFCGEVILADFVVPHMPLIMIMFDTCE
jgi:hypothetical protein